VCVYYCRTYDKAVCGGGREREEEEEEDLFVFNLNTILGYGD
jgi:hypothetical protein